jgi:hypothetical protein
MCRGRGLYVGIGLCGMTDEELLEVIGERNLNRDKIKALVTAMRGVVACFKSRVGGCDDVGCINDHHPSCLIYLEGVLKRVTGGL